MKTVTLDTFELMWLKKNDNELIYTYLLGHYQSINITVAISHVAGVFALEFPKLLIKLN